MNQTEVFVVVTQFMDVQSLGRLARTCKTLHEVVTKNELAWETVFERFQSGTTTTTKISKEWSMKTWRERVKVMMKTREIFEEMKIGIVFSFGVWRIVTLSGDVESGGMKGLPETTWITSKDEKGWPVVLEIVWTSNGWTRMREGQNDWVVWSRMSREQQDLEDQTFQAFVSSHHHKDLETTKATFDAGDVDVDADCAISLCEGTKWIHGGKTALMKEDPTTLWIEISNDQLIVHMPRYPGRDLNNFYLHRDGPSKSLFHSCLLANIPLVHH